MAYYKSNFSVRILRLTLGAFFIILGIAGIFRELGESIFSLKSGYSTLEIIFGVAEIICGLVLFLGLFLFSDSRPIYWAGLIVLNYVEIPEIQAEIQIERYWGVLLLNNEIQSFKNTV